MADPTLLHNAEQYLVHNHTLIESHLLGEDWQDLILDRILCRQQVPTGARLGILRASYLSARGLFLILLAPLGYVGQDGNICSLVTWLPERPRVVEELLLPQLSHRPAIP